MQGDDQNNDQGTPANLYAVNNDNAAPSEVSSSAAWVNEGNHVDVAQNGVSGDTSTANANRSQEQLHRSARRENNSDEGSKGAGAVLDTQ